MALVTAFTWSVLIINQMLTTDRDGLRSAGDWLRHHLPQRFDEVEWSGQELIEVPRGVPLFAVFYQWQSWAFAGSLVVLALLCQWLWKRSHKPRISRNQNRSRSLEPDKEDPLYTDWVLDNYSSWPLPNRQTCTVVEELVNDLLCVCQSLSHSDYKPRLQPAVGVGSFLKRWPGSGGEIVYHLLVPLKPPCGHSFHLQLGTEGDTPVRNSCLRVEPTCMCRRQRFLGDVLCFLHTPNDKLMIGQTASLLQTLCNGSYLDMQKTSFWLQELMTIACTVVLRSSSCKITVLPSTRSCRLKMDNGREMPLYIELTLAVEQDPGTFISLE